MSCAVSFVRRRMGLSETLTRNVPEGTSLLDAARSMGLPIARACAGRALCGRCDLEILDGRGWLSPETPDERATRERDGIPAARRLSCQARVGGPVLATTSYW